MDFDDLPKNFAPQPLKREDLADNAYDQVIHWLQEAKKARVIELNAMCLATATKEGKPSSRTVLLKHIDKEGLTFFTNYLSRKAQEIEDNPRASLTIFWHEQMRQICIEGKVERLPREESERYFATRPRKSQIGAWASEQDKIIPFRKTLEENFRLCEERFQKKEVPLPPFWGGYRVIPDRIEFWQGGKDRLHDRFEYLYEGDRWMIHRLSP